MDKALTGRAKSNGGTLPDDNVRICVPMDLNAILLCGNYARCIAHRLFNREKWIRLLFRVGKSYLATGNLRSSVDSKKPRGHCAERRWRCAAQQSGHRTCKKQIVVSGRYRGYCRVLSVWWDSGTKRSFSGYKRSSNIHILKSIYYFA